MNAATENACTVPTRIEALFALAVAAAAEVTATATDRHGREHTYTADVTLDNMGEITIRVEENAVFGKAASQDLAHRTRAAVVGAWRKAGMVDGVKFRKHGGGHVWGIFGTWHMGHYWCDGRFCTFHV